MIDLVIFVKQVILASMNEKIHIEADICMIMLIIQIETLSFYIIRMKTNITMGFLNSTYI